MELSEWMLYEQIEPFGERAQDLRAGLIAATLVNMNLPKGKDPVQPADFFPHLKQMKAEQESSRGGLAELAAALGAKVVHRDPG